MTNVLNTPSNSKMKIQEKDILYEDNHLIAVSKPATILVQGDHTNDKPLVEMVRSFIKKKIRQAGQCIYRCYT